MGEKGENTLKVNHPTGAASEEHIDTIDKITKASSLTSFSPIKTTEIGKYLMHYLRLKSNSRG